MLNSNTNSRTVKSRFLSGSNTTNQLKEIPERIGTGVRFRPGINRDSEKTTLNDICVVIFDSDIQLNESMASLLSDTEGFFLGGIFENGYSMTQRIRAIQPHVVLMDVKLPDMCSLEAVKLIHHTFPKIKMLMLATFDEDDIVVDAICAGALGFILKNQLRENILETILKLQQGEAPMSPFVLRRVIELLHHLNVPRKLSQYNLTIRETEVMNQMIEGASYKIISARLGIRYDTVHNHIRNIYSKLHVNSMSEAVSKVLKTQMNWLSNVTNSLLLAALSLTPLM